MSEEAKDVLMIGAIVLIFFVLIEVFTDKPARVQHVTVPVQSPLQLHHEFMVRDGIDQLNQKFDQRWR